MSKQKFIRVLFFIICFNFSFTYAKLPDTLFGIKLQSLEDEYVRLLFGPNMDNPSEQQQLSARLSAVQMCLDIDRDLAPLDLHAKTMANKARKLKKPLENVEMRKIFDDLRTKIEQNQDNLGNSDLCKLWDFEQIVVELNQELNVQTPDGTLKLLKKDRVQLEKSFKCSDIERKEQNLWVFSSFTRHLSLKHFKYIDAKFMLGLSSSTQTAWHQWFGTERMPAESELAYRFRILSIRGAFSKLKMVKSVMELLLNEPELGLLEVRHALTLAAEAMREKIFLLTILEFFGNNPNIVANNGNFLEFIFKIENLWQSLAKLFQKLRDDQPAPLFNDLLSQVYSILNELRERLKQIFEIVDGNRRLMSKKFWEIFEVEVSTDNLNTNDSVDNKKSFLECPKVNGMHTGKTSAEEPAAHFLMTLYVGLMVKIENEEMLNNNSIIKELKQNLESAASFWVYSEMIERELFEFAVSLPDKNFDFLVNIGIYKMKWTKLEPELQSVAGDGQLCSLHKFALELVQDKKLKENAGWDKHLKRLLDTSSTFINEPKLVLLADDDGIDCMDVKLASQFVKKLRKVPNCIFCYGIYNVDSLMLKLRLNWIVQRNALRAIETTFPEIMHFEIQLEDTYVDVLLKKLEYKSNSFLAQCYEALLSLPYLLKTANDFENVLLSNTAAVEKIYEGIKQNNPSNWRKNLCILINLNNILAAILPNNLHTFTLNQWERLECNSEKDIKEAFSLPGAKTKLWKMSKDLQQINSNSIVCDQQMNTIDDVFADNKLLASHYDKILFANLDTCDRIAEHLQADVFVFVHWMDGKIRSARRSVANKRSEKFWENQKKNLESIYDRISDEDEPTTLELNSESMGKFFYELKQYMEKGKKPLDEKWDEILHNGCDPTKGSFDPEMKIKYEKWKQTMHKETIISLIRSDQKFTDRLKQAYKSANLKNDLIKIVGVMENADEILKIENATPKTEKKREEVKKEATQKREDDDDDITKVDDEICESFSENVQQNSPIFEEIFADDNCCDIEQFSGLYLSNFEDNNLLATQFEKLIETVLMSSDDSAASFDLTVQLLHFGIYANEIGHRLKLTRHLKGKVLPEIGKATEFANIEREWTENLDKNIIAQYKVDPYLQNIEENPKKKDADIVDLYQISDGWQQMDFDENMSKNMKNIGLIQNILEINRQTEKERSAKWKAINEMRKLFEHWSDEARFQIPALIYLKPINEVFTPICMLPEGFDVTSKIFGNFKCELSERMICSDNSLFCIFCKNANVKLLQKYPMDQQMLAVPKLKINFMRTNFEL
uniref:Uncharacterized protein n=1 Tax=Globodera rostochiensis TaxID=31243 RepID=A0A914HXR3_GLORO